MYKDLWEGLGSYKECEIYDLFTVPFVRVCDSLKAAGKSGRERAAAVAALPTVATTRHRLLRPLTVASHTSRRRRRTAAERYQWAGRAAAAEQTTPMVSSLTSHTLPKENSVNLKIKFYLLLLDV